MGSKIFNKHMWKYVDWFLLVIIFVLVGFGIISLLNVTASPFTGEESTIADYIEKLDFSYVQKQLTFFGIGLAVLFGILFIDYTSVQKITDLIYAICIVFLILVFFLGSEQKGSKGWFMVGGYGIQPAEFAKIGIILAISKVVAVKTEGHDGGIKKIKDIWPALWRLIIPFVLIAAQPDFGSAVVYAAIFMLILFIAKTDWRILLALVLVAVVLLVVVYNFNILEPYQKKRLEAFFRPELQDDDTLFQVNQAKMAIGSGGVWGKGLFAPGSLSQLDYVPEKHNDFIFAVTVETFGLVGGIFVLVLYALLIGRTIMLAMRAKDDFATYVIMGVAAMTLVHVLENIAMNLGIMPVTGISLPFFSYGGSHMLTNMIAYGIVLSVDMRRVRWPIG